MTLPQKCQILDRTLSSYVTVSHFFPYTPSRLCHQENSDELFP